jgi:hypothetical protein
VGFARPERADQVFIVFFTASRTCGFSDWRPPFRATLSSGYSRRKIKVSPMAETTNAPTGNKKEKKEK